jgi:N-carbamoylputrescine amidase
LEAWQAIQRAHAIANGIPVVAVNRIGYEDDSSGVTNGIAFWGNSFAVGPQGEWLARTTSDQETTHLVDIDLKRSEDVRRIWPFFRDRRIDAYHDITKRYID